MPHGPHQAIPSVSCFSGITLCMKTICDSSIKASRLIPVKIKVQHKDIGPADIGFTIQVKPVPLEQVSEWWPHSQARESGYGHIISWYKFVFSLLFPPH